MIFQIRDAQNRIVLDLTDRLTRQMGSVSIAAGAAGSVTVPDAGTGSVWYIFTPSAEAANYSYWPTVTISGDVISWSYTTTGTNGLGASAAAGVLRYGRY